MCPFDPAVPGGGQHHAVELTRRLGNRGVDAYLVAPGTVPVGVPGVSTGPSKTVRANRSAVPLGLTPRHVGATRRALKGADLVHVHEPLMPLVSATATLSGGPGVVTFHADPPRWVRMAYRAVPASVFRRRILTAVSPVARAALPSRWAPVELVPIAIDVDGYRRPVTRHPHRVVFVGRDDPRKGLEVLLDAWPKVAARVSDAELVVVGTRRPGPDGVVWYGRVDEGKKRELLCSAAVAVAPNLGAESFGTVVAEAMAAGCAVVASDLPAFRWVLDGAGVLVPPGSSEGLADAIVQLLEDPEERRRLAVAAGRRVEVFDWDRVVSLYLDAYRRAGDPSTDR